MTEKRGNQPTQSLSTCRKYATNYIQNKGKPSKQIQLKALSGFFLTSIGTFNPNHVKRKPVQFGKSDLPARRERRKKVYTIRMNKNPVLVLAAGSLGDSLLTLPALRLLQSRASVTVAGTSPYLSLG